MEIKKQCRSILGNVGIYAYDNKFYLSKNDNDGAGHYYRHYGLYITGEYWIALTRSNLRTVKKFTNSHYVYSEVEELTPLSMLNSKQRTKILKLHKKLIEFEKIEFTCEGCAHLNNYILTGGCGATYRKM